MGASLRRAVNAKRKDCTYDPLAGLGTWRQQVEGCTVTTCPLWPVRPKSSGNRPIVVVPSPPEPEAQ